MRNLSVCCTCHMDGQLEQFKLRENGVMRLFKGNDLGIKGKDISLNCRIFRHPGDSEVRDGHCPPVPPITGGSHLSSKEKALNKINSFDKNGEASKVFTKLPKERFAEGVRLHINNPAKVNQGSNGTCGAAVICKYLAESLPEKYVEAAISLYTTGKYEEWKLKLPESSGSGTMEQVRKIGTTVADVLIQGAIINSYNYYLDYNPFKDGTGIRSFMWPQRIDSFFDKIGKAGSFHWWTDFDEIKSIDFSRNNIIACVVLEHVHNNEYRFTRDNLIPNHYIQITDCGNDTVFFWQWGDEYVSKNGDTYFIYETPK